MFESLENGKIESEEFLSTLMDSKFNIKDREAKMDKII